MPSSYNIVELNVDAFYTRKPRERIFTFSRRMGNTPLSDSWKIGHWQEFVELAAQQQKHECTLTQAVRYLFHHRSEHLADIVESLGLSLPELSLVVKPNTLQGRIFIPNISIKRAREGDYRRHSSLQEFLSSTSCNLVLQITQNTAANPQSSLDEAEKNRRFHDWVEQYGSRAKELLKGSLKLHPGEGFAEGESHDILLGSLNHPLYEEIAPTVVLERKLAQTLDNGVRKN